MAFARLWELGIMADTDTPDKGVKPPAGAENAADETRRTASSGDGSLFAPGADQRAAADAVYQSGEDEQGAMRMGQKLRQVRESLGFDLNVLAKELKIRAPYLMAIERMEVQTVPQGYLNPYLRAYANRLGLPAEQVIETYRAECGGVDEVQAAAPVLKLTDMQTHKSRLPLYFGAAAAASLAVVAGLVLFSGNGEQQESVIASAVPVAVNGAHDSLFADTGDAMRPAARDLPLSLIAVRQGWIEVRGADGTIFRSRVMATGEVYFPRLGADWTVSARDGGAFEWRVGDIVIGPLGPEETPVYALNVDAAATEAAEKVSPAMAANGGATPSR